MLRNALRIKFAKAIIKEHPKKFSESILQKKSEEILKGVLGKNVKKLSEEFKKYNVGRVTERNSNKFRKESSNQFLWE